MHASWCNAAVRGNYPLAPFEDLPAPQMMAPIQQCSCEAQPCEAFARVQAGSGSSVGGFTGAGRRRTFVQPVIARRRADRLREDFWLIVALTRSTIRQESKHMPDSAECRGRIVLSSTTCIAQHQLAVFLIRQSKESLGCAGSLLTQCPMKSPNLG